MLFVLLNPFLNTIHNNRCNLNIGKYIFDQSENTFSQDSSTNEDNTHIRIHF